MFKLHRLRQSRSYTSDPDRFWQIAAICAGAVVLVVLGFL